MPASFPTLQSGQVTRYPTSRQMTYKTGRAISTNGSEQRWISAPPLAAFMLQFTDIQQSDLNNISDFFQSQKGMFSSTAGLVGGGFSITFDTVTYDYCVFDQDALTDVEKKSNLFSFTLKIRRVRPGIY